MAENIGGVFNAKIPSISDNADIQTAFRLYHYGLSEPGNPDEESISGHLGELTSSKLSLNPTTIPTTADLNSYNTTGFYTQTGTPTGPNYPSSFPGLLIVVNKDNTVFQQYQVIGAPESGSSINTINRTHWRFFFGGSWRPWRTFVEQSDFASIGDVRYFTRTEASSLFLTQASAASNYLTITEANTRLYLQENLKTANHTLELSDVNRVVAMNNTSAVTVTVPFNTTVDFPIGSVVNVYRAGTGDVTIAAATGVTIRNAGKLYEQYTEVSLRKRAINEWVASGNIIPV